MMAMAGPPSGSGLLPLLESLEDSAAGQSEQTDAYLTIANRLSGEDGRQFLPAVEKHFSRLGKIILTHITNPNAELNQAALQALGFCVYHAHVVSGVPENFAAEILSALCSLVVKSIDKNTCTRALWVISKQSFPPEVVAKKVPSILSTLENMWTRADIHSVVMEHEALNVIIRMLEQVPAQMGDGAVQWAKLVIPLVVHSASKVRLRAAAAMEMGLPLLLDKQMEVAAIIEPMMSSKLIPELQKLFMSKNEANVLKLWPLFVRLLGKLLHRGGPFINSLLHLEELGFRSSSANIKKIAFIAWKSLIDNFALNPDILCSAKRMKLLMQPLSSIHVRTEALLLSKLEVWWYLVVRLGPNLGSSFEQVSVPLLQCTIGADSSAVPATPARGASQNGAVAPATPATPKTGTAGFSSPAATPRMNLNSSVHAAQNFPSIQLLGLEMLLHYFLGPEVVATAAEHKLTLTLEPLTHPFLSGVSSFTKHAALLISTVRDAFITVGKEAPGSLLALVWKSLVGLVSSTIESGSKKDRQGCEVLTLMLQALQSIVSSETLPADRVLVLFQTTVNGVPQRVLGSASYQVGKMDVLNGTPALFLILLFYNSSMLPAYVEEERFFQCLHTLVGCGLSGPTSPLVFGEAALGAIGRTAGSLGNKEQLWRMWSAVVSPLTETITQSNEVNQGDALEHNFSAVHSALMFPVTHLLPGTPLNQMTHKSMLITWSKLYKVFARCSALVATAEENICCEELCAKMAAILDKEALAVPSTLDAVASILQVMVDCVDFSPYTPQFQQKMTSPHTPLNWMRKKNKALGNLSTYQSLLVQSLEAFLAGPGSEAAPEAAGLALVSVLSALFTNLALTTAIREALASLAQPLTLLYKQAASEPPKFSSQLVMKLEKLLGDVLGCLQTCSTLAYDDDLLALLSSLLCVVFPHKNKQLRTAVTQFWNATFANSVSLTYPDELRPVLSQVKQKTPVILPGFQALGVPDELSGQYSSEGSQLETKLSGVQVSSVVKRDSLLARAAELKDRTKTTSKPVSQAKLDFGSPKPPRREVLEEEASIDFVFIPPETKERVLTEHQKEVKRTKRVDIPAMYNNLDASLDTSVFTQYSQSQEDSIDKLSAEEPADGVAKEVHGEVHQVDMEVEEEAEILTKETQHYASPKATENMAKDPRNDEDITPESVDVSMEDTNDDDCREDMEVEPEEGTSPNVSGSSDLVTGTPQKPSSRRQSFITLEKYCDGKPASPISVTKFTGPHTKTSNSQENTPPPATSSSSPTSQTVTGMDSQVSQSSETGEMKQSSSVNILPESSQVTQVDSSEEKREPEVKLNERLSSEGTGDEDDVIPDTQTEAEDGERTNNDPTAEESQILESQMQGEESEDTLEECSPSQSTPGEPRRSGRRRVRPLLPGQNAEERDEKYNQKKRPSVSKETESKDESPKTSLTDRLSRGRPSTRSKQAAEVGTRSQKDKSELSQTSSQVRTHRKIKLYSNSGEMLGRDERVRRGTTEDEFSQTDSQTDTQSDNDSQSQGRCSTRSQSVEDGRPKRRGRSMDKNDSQGAANSQSESQSQGKAGRRSKVLSNSEEFMPVEQAKKDEVEPSQSESQMATPSPQIDSQFQGRTSRRSKLVSDSEELIKDKCRTRSATGGKLSQDNSQVLTPSDSDSQLQGRSRRRSKLSSKAMESEDKSESIDSPKRENKTESQTTPLAGRFRGRPRKIKVEDEPSKSSNSPSLSPDSSQSLDMVGSVESSQGRSRYSGRRSSQALLTNMETSESESSENKQDTPMLKRRGKKTKAPSVPSPLTLGPGECKVDQDTAMDSSESSQKTGLQSTPTSATVENKNLKDLEDSLKCGDIQVSRPPLVTKNVEEQSNEETHLEVEVGSIIDSEPENTKPSLSDQELKSKQFCLSPHKREHGPRQSQAKLSIDYASSQESDIRDLKAPESPQESDIRDVKAPESPQESDIRDLKAPENPQESDIRDLKAPESPQESDIRDLKPPESPQESDIRDLKAPESPKSEEIRTQQEFLSDLPVPSAEENSMLDNSVPMEPVNSSSPPVATESSADTLTPSGETIEKLSLQVSESSEEKVLEVAQPVKVVTEEQVVNVDPSHPEPSNVPVEDTVEEDSTVASTGQDQLKGPSALDELPEKFTPISEAEEQITPIKEGQLEFQDTKTSVQEKELQGDDQEIEPLTEREEKDDARDMECDEEELTQIDNNETDLVCKDSVIPLTDASVPPETQSEDVCQDSPAKQKGLEALTGLEVGQSPSSGRTRGTWSPSASPSTSILKKGQKRALEEDTPSPLVKSRRVSFADPIQHQELADDIDRRSPVIRTSSPKRTKTTSGIPQPKYVTTPTKGLLILRPRNLHSPGYKSSKKCLMSEMSQEPRPIPTDCVYPGLVGCSTPVEAVLPQITSNMWPRGFGQLLRSRNIKTVGDLSALTPTGIKTLPIRSPKISNVKKALKSYHEQQHKGRGGDELKSFDEMEKMTSELEESHAPQNQEEEDKSPGELLATELVDEPMSACRRSEQDSPSRQPPEGQPRERTPTGQPNAGGLLSAAESLMSRMTSEELSRCSPEQLVQLHDRLGGAMRSVVVELQTRLCRADGGS